MCSGILQLPLDTMSSNSRVSSSEPSNKKYFDSCICWEEYNHLRNNLKNIMGYTGLNHWKKTVKKQLKFYAAFQDFERNNCWITTKLKGIKDGNARLRILILIGLLLPTECNMCLALCLNWPFEISPTISLGEDNFANAIERVLMKEDVFTMKPLEGEMNFFHFHFQTSESRTKLVCRYVFIWLC